MRFSWDLRAQRIRISLAVLIPLIVSGTAVLGILVSERLMTGLSWDMPLSGKTLTWLCLSSGGLVFVVASGVLFVVLRPIRRFLAQASLTAVLPRADDGDTSTVVHDPGVYDRMFDQVAGVLERIDAKALFPEIIGESRAMRAVFSWILKVAPTQATVLVTGESGTGKELVARSIHGHGTRSKGPFVVVNCAAIPEGLMESELFGHEKGSFTGAHTRKKGKFSLADGGTLFLDEIGDMPLETQSKILRALENREIEPVGGEKSIKVDVRVIAATHRHLVERIREGRFREDLFFRLNVVSIHLPPLRDRRDDIPILCTRFLEKSGREIDLSAEAMAMLMSYAWPGNVRELKNLMERVAVLVEGGSVEPRHLPPVFSTDVARSASIQDMPGLGLDERLAEFEKSVIRCALARSSGVQVRAAEILGIKERSLWHRIKKYEIDPNAFKKVNE